MSKIELLNQSRMTAMKEKKDVAKALFSTLKGEYENAIKTGSPVGDVTIEKLAKKMTENAKTIGSSEALEEIELLKPFMPIMLTEAEVRNIIKISIDDNPDKANKYKLGSKGAFIGVVMKQIAGKADSTLVNEIITEVLS